MNTSLTQIHIVAVMLANKLKIKLNCIVYCGQIFAYIYEIFLLAYLPK